MSLVSSDFFATVNSNHNGLRIQLFFPTGCFPLQKPVDGVWTPSTCSSGLNNLNSICKLQCNQDYELRGSANVQCTNQGWNSTNGNFIPRCVREYGLCYFIAEFLLSSVEKYRLHLKLWETVVGLEGIDV